MYFLLLFKDASYAKIIKHAKRRDVLRTRTSNNWLCWLRWVSLVRTKTYGNKLKGCAPGVAKTGKCGSANALRREIAPNFAATGTTNSCSLVGRKRDQTMTETMQNNWMAMMNDMLYAVYAGTKNTTN